MAAPKTENTIKYWVSDLPRPAPGGHKYDRGHAAIYSAAELTGATRLAAEACSRIGAGLVTVLAGQRADFYRTVLPPDVMVRDGEIGKLKALRSALVGPGGFDPSALDDLSNSPPLPSLVLDAAAIAHVNDLQSCAEAIVITPHEGEFARHFPDRSGARETSVVSVAMTQKVFVVLKGEYTLIASPSGDLIENDHASPYLAKAGTGDVLAGLITGLLAQGMAPLKACAAAVWINGEAGLQVGPGLIAGDLPTRIPSILNDLGFR